MSVPEAGSASPFSADSRLAAAGSLRFGIDVGGTFTDIVAVGEDGSVTTRKVLSTPDDYSRSVRVSLPGMLEQRGSGSGGVREVIHGTTVATNAILQQRGAATALITTRGFRDVLELRRIRMPELYNWQWDTPPDLVERRLRFEVSERIDARGNVLTPLDLREAARVIDQIAALGVESLAVCLLNSYVNPAHEEALARLIRERHPGLTASISSHILREVKEYERTATTVVNAYVAPVVSRYIRALSTSLGGLGIEAPLLVMQSNGGVMTAEACARRPV
ncbi:MAG: hydantoinase/oxoprolinase family protein, partial [Acidobacteria bacterium]|nr:hydantoinase/oxoprolinase family protein [Acidobacteriota bacterium]